MNRSRRQFLRLGGGVVATLSLPPAAGSANDIVEIRMQGRKDGSHVWFDPIGLQIEPGQLIRWINGDPGNSHTSTVYHPEKFNRPLRMPRTAEPWDSDYLLPNEAFTANLTVPGVYDYYCHPHEHAGMVGRIVVGTPSRQSWINLPSGMGEGALPLAAINALPSVEEILQKGIVRQS
jgi:plastocyanin